MTTQLKNSKGELFKVGQEVICMGTKYSGPACGVSQSMRNCVGKVMVIRDFVDPTRKIVRFKNNGWAWHLDDFASDGKAFEKLIKAQDVPDPLVKWASLNGKLYTRYHSNLYYLFLMPDDVKSVTWEEVENSIDKFELTYTRHGYERKVTKKGTGYVKAIYTNVTSCFGGFMGTYDNFRRIHKKPPTHCIQRMQFPRSLTPRYIAKNKFPEGYQAPTTAQWKEYIDHMIRGSLLPSYLKTDEIFADDKAKFYDFTLKIDKISKERWYFYASIIRNLGEYPRMVHAVNGMLRDTPQLHPLVALIMASSVYCTRTHAAVETTGLFDVMKNYASIELKDIADYASRVAKFLTQACGHKILPKERQGFAMWRIFKCFRKQGTSTAGLIPIRTPKKAYASLDALLSYNPFTREVA